MENDSAKNSNEKNFSDQKLLPEFFSLFSIWGADYVQL